METDFYSWYEFCLFLPIGPQSAQLSAGLQPDPLTTRHYTDQGTYFKAKKVQQWAYYNGIY